MNSEMSQLAIVIPAYKPDFFAEALESIANQTEKRFRVYIGDDASPADLKSIVDRYHGRLDITYHRFENNLGGTSLVKQWNRCVEMSSEPWVWLFSDDDIMEPMCVENFLTLKRETNDAFSVYRFNANRIDSKSQTIKVNAPHPDYESAFDFLYFKFTWQRSSYAPDHIFSRSAFDLNNGFVDFKMAWCADDASWALFSLPNGIATVQSARIYWRLSGKNVSTCFESGVAIDKLKAVIEFGDWLSSHISKLERANSGVIDSKIFLRASTQWALRQWDELCRGLDHSTAASLAENLSKPFSLPKDELLGVYKCFHVDKCCSKYPFVNKLPEFLAIDHPIFASFIDTSLRILNSTLKRLCK